MKAQNFACLLVKLLDLTADKLLVYTCFVWECSIMISEAILSHLQYANLCEEHGYRVWSEPTSAEPLEVRSHPLWLRMGGQNDPEPQ